MKTIPLSDSLSLPLNAVTQRLAWLGRPGSARGEIVQQQFIQKCRSESCSESNRRA